MNLLCRGQRLQHLVGPRHRGRRVGIRIAQCRVEIEVHEHLGDALLGQCLNVVRHLVQRSGERPFAGTGQDDAAADEAQGLWVTPGLLGCALT